MIFAGLIVQAVFGTLLILLILLHAPKGGGLGLDGMSQLFSSQSTAESSLNRVTTIVAVIFMVTSIFVGFNIPKFF